MPNNLNPFDPNKYEVGSSEYWRGMFLRESKRTERLQHILWHIEAHVTHCISDKPITRTEMLRIIKNNLNFWQGLLNENNKLRLRNEVLKARLGALQEKREVHKLVKEEK